MVWALADDLGVEAAVDQDDGADLVQFFGIEDVAAAADEFFLNGFVEAVDHDDGLFGSTDHAVVESIGMDDGADSQQYFGGIIDNGGRVAGADTDGGKQP